ncbi:MAG: ABC transporter substrate-binding protein [Alphaproteobacteria bacterium]
MGSRRRWQSLVAAGLAAAFAAGIAAGATAQEMKKITVFSGPVPKYDAVWMADANGFYKAEGLDIAFRDFPSGTTALQTFMSGQGDIVFNGDLPGVRHWIAAKKDYRLITIFERSATSYIVAARKEIAKPMDLKGKIVATRVGSTGSWFIAEFVNKNNIGSVDIKNLDTQVLPTALCQGDISAFFIWQPFGSRALEVCPDKVHILATAEGYINGYAVGAARASWLATPEGADIAKRFLRATIKGLAIAEKDFPAVAAYAKAKYGLSEAATKADWDINIRANAFDKVFYSDYCSLAEWMRSEKLMEGKFDISEFIWTDGLASIDPKRVLPTPPPC